MKKKRLTICVDESIIWLLRNKQAEMMLESNHQVSISNVANLLIKKGIKAEKVNYSKLESAFVNLNGSQFRTNFKADSKWFPKNLELKG